MCMPGFIRDAGMFANTNVELPRGVGTRSPEDVAAAVVKAIEHNRAELEVAPLGLRLGATFAGVAPELAAAAARRLGSTQGRVRHGRRPARHALTAFRSV